MSEILRIGVAGKRQRAPDRDRALIIAAFPGIDPRLDVGLRRDRRLGGGRRGRRHREPHSR